MILLVHSCDSREWIWEHWYRFFKESKWDIKPIIITERRAEFKHPPHYFMAGDVPFSDQLHNALTHFKDEYIWYTLDDYFIKFPIDFDFYWNLVHELKADALRVQPNVNILKSFPYRFEWAGDLFKQRSDSPYTISTHTSVWRREYFLDCLTPGLDPWQLEGTIPENFGDVYFVPKLPFWYIDGTLHGVLTDTAKQMMKQ